MNFRTAALAFRIWAFAKPKGWDCTIYDIADAVGETPQRVARICQMKGWTSRLRASKAFYLDVKMDSEEEEFATLD